MDSSLKNTSKIQAPQEPLARSELFLQRCRNSLSNVWTSTHFDEAPVAGYAERLMVEETRKGITMMAFLSLATHLAAVVLYQKLGVQSGFLYTYALLALLSLHVIVSVRFVSDLSALNLLGTVLLVFTGVAIMAIAHRTESLNAGLMSSIVLLFMVMPLVPWALREACIIVILVYLAITFSFLSVEGRFDSQTLWTVQFLILASATTATLTIVRNTVVRKDDIRARFELEDAHRELQHVSTRDPLTGARNRRFLEQNFDDYAQHCHDMECDVQLALLDIDKFKYFNDTFGHHHGDLILQHLANVFIESLPGSAHLIRIGGDEFTIIYSGDDLDQLVSRCLDHLCTDPVLLEQSGGIPVTVSVGFAASKLGTIASLPDLYEAADAALYRAKDDKASTSVNEKRPRYTLLSNDAVKAGA